MGSKVIHLLRREERKTRLRFLNVLAHMSGKGAIACPFTQDPPPGAIELGTMPKFLRAAFMQAYKLRSHDRQSEAEVFEEAVSDLLQEHFRKTYQKKGGIQHVGQFRIGKDWKVYAMPLPTNASH